MRTTWKSTVFIATVASLLLVPQLAAAESVEDQLQQMQNRMSQLEDQLQSTNDQLSHANSRVEEQAGVIERAGLADDDSAVSALSSFLSDTDFYGWVEASYTVQTHTRHSGGIVGQNAGGPNSQGGQLLAIPMPNMPDNMTFKLNQLWFGMDNAATADSRGGFHADIFFGSDAGEGHLNGFGCGGFNNLGGGDTDTLCLFTAYASYLAPIGPNGIEVQVGKLPTMLGAEVVQTPWNFNITRGLLWGIQPVTNMGLLTSADLGSGFGLALGVIDNPLSIADPDINLAKSFTGQVSWSNDKFGAALSGNWGEASGANRIGAVAAGSQTQSIMDLVLSADPIDSLSLWLNFDWRNIDGAGVNQWNTYGLAIAGRYAINDKAGIALRGEWLHDDFDGNRPAGTQDQWSATVTGDYHLTDNLMVRGEFRYDEASFQGQRDNAYCGSGVPVAGVCQPGSHDRQFSFIADIVYEF